MKNRGWVLSLTVVVITFIAFGFFNEKAVAMDNTAAPTAEPNQHDPNDDEMHPGDTGEDLISDPNVDMVFDTMVHDFGDIAPNSINKCEFKFTNKGTALLRVKKKIGTTCGCTAPKLEKEEYQPGESGVIKVVYTTNSRPGPTEKHLNVYSNNRDKNITLTIKANTVEKIAFEPSRINLVLNKENAGCPNITVKSKDGKQFSITRVTAPDNAIIAEFDPAVKSAEFVIKPQVDMDKIKKHPNGLLSIYLTHPNMDKIDIPYAMLSPFKADPATIIALNAKSSVPINRTVYILSNYEEPFEIKSIEATEDFIKVVKKEKLDDNRYQIDFEIMPPIQTGRRHFSCSAIVTFSDENTLTINVIGSLAK